MGESTKLVQSVAFFHEPAMVRRAALKMMGYRSRDPKVLLALAVLLGLVVLGFLLPSPLLLSVSIGGAFAIVLILARYVQTCPRTFCGTEIQLAISDLGLHFESPNRSGTVNWAGVKTLYVLDDMWALILERSEYVTLIRADKLDRETIAYAVQKLSEAGAKIYGYKGT